jgi:MOSC domain-containing protein YiiM
VRGRVEAIHVAPAAGAPMEPRARVRLVAGRGIEGDRYAAGTGHWSPIRRRGDGLTVIAAEMIRDVNAEYGLTLTDAETRRNVTVSGIDLDGLLGREFRIGSVRLRAARRCEPCQYLEGLLGQDVLVPLVHRAGIRVEVLEDGEIAAGDPVEAA